MSSRTKRLKSLKYRQKKAGKYIPAFSLNLPVLCPVLHPERKMGRD
jgi:hypothetical protein